MMRLCRTIAIAVLFIALSHTTQAAKVAITFDDLPLNGSLPPGVTQTQIASDVVALLKKRGMPPTYGFINAKKLEGSPDGAEALKVWIAGGQKVGNHTYSHIDLHRS